MWPTPDRAILGDDDDAAQMASTVPDVLPYNATETKLPVAAIHTGHVLRNTVQGATPPIHNNSISKPNATDAETTSRVKNIGMHRINAPMKRLTGLIRATNHDGDAGFVSFRRPCVHTMVSGFSLPSRPLFLLVSSMSLPLSTKIRRAPSASISGSSCVIMMTAQPWSRAPAINWTMLVHVVKSCPNVGSSMTSTFGAAASMDATDSLLFSPPDRVNGFALAKRERFRRSNSRSAMEYASSSVLPMDLGPMATSSRTVDGGELVFGLLEHHADTSQQFAAFPCDHIVFAMGRYQIVRHAYTSCHRFEQSCKSESECGFAHAVSAGQRGHLTGMEFEIDMLAEREIIAKAQIPRAKHDVLRLPDLFLLGRVAFGWCGPAPTRHRRQAPDPCGRTLRLECRRRLRRRRSNRLRVAQHDDAVDQVEPHVDMMFHHNQRLMGLFEDVADSVVHFLDTLRVKVGGRFVKQQQARVHGQHARQGEALTLPAGKSSCGPVERHVVEPDDVKGGRAPVPIIFRGTFRFSQPNAVSSPARSRIVCESGS